MWSNLWLRDSRWWQHLGSIYLLLLAIGVVAFALSDRPVPITDAYGLVSGEPTDAEDYTNWGSVRAGARVRAVNWDYFRSHHPLFVIDGEPRPTELEKWASLPGTDFPWLEIGLAGPHDLQEVVIRHAGWRERSAYTNDRYTLRCYRGDTLIAELAVTDNREPVARHSLACSGADRLLIVLDCTGKADLARIYEIEAWGPAKR